VTSLTTLIAAGTLLASLPGVQEPGTTATRGSNSPTTAVERHLAAMGTWLHLNCEAPDRSTALRGSEAAARAIEAVEKRLSTWRDDSELSRFNRFPVGESFPLSSQLAADLRFARDIVHETNGAFDPALAPLVSAFGLRTGGRLPSAQELLEARAASGLRHLHIAEDRAQRLHPQVAIEEGGFGKGIGLDAALRAARESGVVGGSIDLGGQLALIGVQTPQVFGIAHPARRDETCVRVSIDHGSLATSGNSERGIVIAGARRSHLLDPRTGQPSPDFGSVSVWSSSAARADALSTALFVMGPEEALRFAEGADDCEVVCLVLQAEKTLVLASSGLADKLSILSPDTSFGVTVSNAPTKDA